MNKGTKKEFYTFERAAFLSLVLHCCTARWKKFILVLGKNDFAIVSVGRSNFANFQIKLNLIFEKIRFENFKFNFNPSGVTNNHDMKGKYSYFSILYNFAFMKSFIKPLYIWLFKAEFPWP